MQPEQAKAVLRDLRWAVHSPVLCGVAPPFFSLWAAQTDALFARLATDTSLLPDELWQRRRSPIGRYFESLIGFWLEQQAQAIGLKQNIPIFDGTRTLGELDLVFQVDGTAYHWELAVKLYLGTGSCCHMSDWLGPLARDRLDMKITKLFERQLRLPSLPEARSALDDLGIEKLQSHALVKGYLFHPYARWKAGKTSAPAEVSVRHAQGWWLRIDRAHELAHVVAARYQVLEKAAWLGPASGSGAIARTDIVDWLAAYFDSGEQRPPLLAAIDEQGRELHRGFVVPNDWGHVA